MSEAETEIKPPKPPPEKPKLTNRSVAWIGLSAVGALAAVALLPLVGPWAAAAVPVAAVGGGYVRHRMKNPRKSRTKTGGSLSWPFTGNQSRRALSRLGIGSKKSAGGNKGTTGSRGGTRPGTRGLSGLRLPRTTRSRAAAGAGGVLPKRSGRRSVGRSTSAGAGRSAGAKPKGVRAPKTASKTPARPATSQRLTGPKQAAGTSRKGSTPGRSSTHRRPNLRLLQGGKSSKGGRSGSPLSTRKATPPAHRKTSSPKVSSSGSKRSTSGARATKKIRGVASRLGRTISPFRTSPSGRHRRLKSPFRTTKQTLPSRRSSKLARNRDRVPHRSAKRPTPYKRARARSLLRMALGIPTIRAGRLAAVTTAKRRRARRTLRLRALTRLFAVRHFPGFLSRLPGLVTRWSWDRFWSGIPQPPKPEHEWTATAPKPKAVAAPGPRYVVPVPSTRPMEVSTMSSNPQQMIIEAFAQLSAYHTQSATEMERHLSADHEMWQQIGQAIVSFADNVQTNMPYGPATCDALRDLGAAVSSIAGVSENVHSVFRSEHEIEINRIEQPRADEKQWDVGNQ